MMKKPVLGAKKVDVACNGPSRDMKSINKIIIFLTTQNERKILNNRKK